ncbi:cation diffusion facilitator family transporter [Acinetobacter sp. CAAS 2-6]|uniref:cation diffusion facilitator family transporter n=1 Tax=Acinetobacter sp. CAAS 2-6 TaxID=3016358 RepID=UPI002DD6AFD2|nr:cation diffusion facilitator family transporter [Acinetobacter sp. CAAS 2-6]
MAHGHSHAHSHTHYGRAFAIGILLNLGFVLIEAFYGWQAGSMALLADAGHNLTDVGGLLLAWAAYGAARIHANQRHTYGWRKASILASFINAVLILLAMLVLAWESLQRIQTPSPVEASTMMLVAAIGVGVNALTAWLFQKDSAHDLNIRGAFLHMAADAAVSLGVVVAGALYLWQGWLWIDAVLGLIISLLIIWGTWSLFHQSLHLLFDGVPEHISVPAVQECLLAIPAVSDLHDLHIWSMSTQEHALTVHVVYDAHLQPADELLDHLHHCLHERFDLQHITVQLESADYAQHCVMNHSKCHMV